MANAKQPPRPPVATIDPAGLQKLLKGLPDDLKSRIGKIGDMNSDQFLAKAEGDAGADDPMRVRLGAEELRVLAVQVRAEADRIASETAKLNAQRDYILAVWKTDNPSVEPDGAIANEIDAVDTRIKESERDAGRLRDLASKLSLREQVAGDRLLAPGSGLTGVAEPMNVADKLRQSAVTLLDPDQQKKKPDINAAQIAMAQAMAANAIDPMGTSWKPLRHQMKRAEIPETPDTALWFKLRRASLDIGWESYSNFMESVLCADPSLTGSSPDREAVKTNRIALPFPDCDAYRFVKAATEVFMMVNCGTLGQVLPDDPTDQVEDLAYLGRRMGRSYTATEIQTAWNDYLVRSDKYVEGVDGAHPVVQTLPYLALIRAKLSDAPLVEWSQGQDFNKALVACSGILREKLASPCFLELIWSYWHEEGMLVQSVNAITRRFQNVRTPGDRDPLAGVEIDPLRPLSNLLWGYVQDEQHRLSVVRRAYEYDHHYGLALIGKAVSSLRGADSRSRFLEAFHNLLHLATIFFKEDDDTTVIADGFPVLNALREVHLLLSQGAHNQFGDLPWAARQEMLMQQWILARPEMREFLPTRTMVAYRERWQDSVDAMKSLMNWTNASVLHFSELGTYGERILLGARFNDWSTVIEPERASNWARFWRPEIQAYIHAYRAVTGIDLSSQVEATMPSTLLRNRLAAQRVAAR